MIKRTWRGWTTPERADRYERLLRSDVFPSIESMGVEGLRKIELFRRDGPDEVEFFTIMTFESMEAVREFRGVEHDLAYVPESAKEILTRTDERSRHYQLKEERRYGPK